VIRRLIVLAASGLGLAALADRLLALDPFVAGTPTGRPIRSEVEIDAPQGLVWRAISDIPAQPLWMREMKAVRLHGNEPVGVGTTGEADVRIFGIGVTDPVEVTAWEPPTRFAIRHTGLFSGGGEIVLEPGADGATTRVTWEERLIPPFFPEIGALVGRPILGRIFQEDLELLKELVESGELPRRA
jgi:uncharacterized protein YndB with AHSA1/START domain